MINKDLDYAKGYYDGFQGMPVLGFSIAYKQGHEDGHHDQKVYDTAPAWSADRQAAIYFAYHRWIDLRDSDEV